MGDAFDLKGPWPDPVDVGALNGGR